MKIYSLGKEEIIRGYKAFENVLNSGLKTETANITSYSLLFSEQTGINVKTGFFISKKKLKKLTIETGLSDCFVRRTV